MANDRLVNDLSTHVLSKHAARMGRALDLIEDETERYAFMVTVVGSEITTLMATLAHANPRLAALPEERQFVTIMFLLQSALGYGRLGAPDAQGLSDIYAALHPYPKIELS